MIMEGNRRASKMAAISLAIVLMFVLAACGKQAANTVNNSSAETPQVTGTVNSAAPKSELISQKERALAIFFRGILQMDNKGELMITKDQATALLPLVNKSTKDGEIKTENQQKMMDIFTKEQKAFLDDLTARFKQFTTNRNDLAGSNRPALTDEQKAQFQKDRPQLTDAQRKKFQENRAQGKQGQNNSVQGNGWINGGDGENVEQQLIDLLDSKMNN
jgi:hypothetical protein